MNLQLSPQEAAQMLLERRKARKSLTDYAAQYLWIRTKLGPIERFAFNRVQRHIHGLLEGQKARTGKVRAIILKGRQQGCSTYVAARFYHRVTQENGMRVFILTHEDAATQNLFEIVNRYHEHLPDYMRPSTGAANAKELNFDGIDSGYKVATAGTKGVGRSSTIQLFHGSEVAFWPNADSHAAGVLQAVPDMPGTEVILESTANGLGNFFHQRWRDAEKDGGEYQTIFVPWFWQDEYRHAAPPNFTLNREEEEYAAAYGLDMAQMAWRRRKLAELKDPLLFKQEYPATAAEAFQMTGHDSYIPPGLVMKARANRVTPYGPLIIGYDPAWTGDARHAMAWRRGRRLEHVQAMSGLDTMQGAGWAKKMIDMHKPERMFIDVGGVGAGIYDRLAEMGYVDRGIVRAINFGSSPFESYGHDRGGPSNRRAEMWMKSKQWLEDPAGVQIPDDDELQADACGPAYTYNSNSELVLERKDQMKKRGVPSPDKWDAVALTFAEPVFVPDRDEEDLGQSRRTIEQAGRSSVTGY